MSETLAEWEARYHKPKRSAERAVASTLPCQSGDGYGYGGGALVTIGDDSLLVGEGDGMFELAKEIARRWNHVANVCEHRFGNAVMLPQGGAQATCEKCGLVATRNDVR